MDKHPRAVLVLQPPEAYLQWYRVSCDITRPTVTDMRPGGCKQHYGHFDRYGKWKNTHYNEQSQSTQVRVRIINASVSMWREKRRSATCDSEPHFSKSTGTCKVFFLITYALVQVLRASDSPTVLTVVPVSSDVNRDARGLERQSPTAWSQGGGGDLETDQLDAGYRAEHKEVWLGAIHEIYVP